jgi:hypothetical protein
MEIESIVGPISVIAAIRTAVPSGETLLCSIGDLKVTPWHSVAVEEEGKCQWVTFPVDLMSCRRLWRSAPSFYSQIKNNMMLVRSLLRMFGASAWSSASQDGRAHVFLGDYEKVLRDLSALDCGWGGIL